MNRHQVPQHLKRESELQPEVVGFFEGLGCQVYVTSEPRKKYCSPGIFDLYLILPQRRGTAWFDTKQPGKELDIDQLEFAKHLDFAGIRWSSGALPEAHTFAQDLGIVWRLR